MRIVLALFLSAATVFSAETVYKSTEYRFQIQPPVVKEWNNSGIVASFMLPAAEGFADNVNVMIQPFEGTIKDYRAITEAELKNMKVKIIQVKESDPLLIIEYAGEIQGRQLHWYQRAYSTGGKKIYLITATCLASRWEQHKQLLMDSVDSFAIKK